MGAINRLRLAIRGIGKSVPENPPAAKVIVKKKIEPDRINRIDKPCAEKRDRGKRYTHGGTV